MQPHRVESAIFDEVGDAPDYYRSEWLKNPQDTDAIFDSSCDYCDAAGPEKCALYTVGGKEKIKERFKHIVEALRGNPIGAPTRGALAPELITYSDLRSKIWSAVYTPLQYWSSLAELLVDLEYRHGGSFAMLRLQKQQVLTPPSECHNALP
ncbi:hypothetical protein N7G274_006575 [Stereocaulon virgatum]|uniref:Uncharacterized protein n=1 Tax=Stereocaulon virgatum TaxID=373712 RepID=A0ABR4A6Q9_9LECA